ncbi:MAG: fatty acid desaturase, partial [Psychrobacillus psychrodurans]
MSREKTLELRKNVKPFENSELKKSIVQLINTIPPFFILWFLAYISLDVSVWLTVALSVIAAGFVVRIF